MKYLHLLQRLSEKSDGEAYRIGAILVKGGSVINAGFNHSGTNRMIENHRHLRPNNNTIHAEIHAILGTPKHIAEHCSMYVARFTPGGRIGNSKPCTLCQAILKEMGVKRVMYTIAGKNTYQQLNL